MYESNLSVYNSASVSEVMSGIYELALGAEWAKAWSDAICYVQYL